MKILFITYGLAHYYTQVLNKLNLKPGIEIVVIVPEGKSKNVGDGVLLCEAGNNFKILHLHERVYLKIFGTYDLLADVLQDQKPDIIVTPENFIFALLLFPSLVLKVRLNNIKLILRSIPFGMPPVKELIKSIIVAKRFSDKVKFSILLILRKMAYRSVNAHLNYADEAYAYYGEYGVPENRIFVSRNSPDTDIFFKIRKVIETESSFLPKCSMRLIHVGRLVEWKRVDLLIQAHSIVKQTHKDAELLILGSGPQEKHLRQLVENKGSGKSVQFLGDIHDPYSLGRYLMSSTLYVLAGMGGLSINDAMSFGLPILCSRCDGTETFLVRDGYNGLYFKEGDVDDLAAKILELHSNIDRLKLMGERSTQIIINEVNVNTVLQVYVDAFNFVTKK